MNSDSRFEWVFPSEVQRTRGVHLALLNWSFRYVPRRRSYLIEIDANGQPQRVRSPGTDVPAEGHEDARDFW